MSFRSTKYPKKQAGSVIFTLFAGIAMVGILGAAAMTMLKGPVRAMNEITRRTVAENNMIAAGKLAIIAADTQNGDCDGDGAVEPVEWADPAGKPAPVQGGLLPTTIGAAQMDPWGNNFGYCSWDHGAQRLHADCGTTPKRLTGSITRNNIVLAVLSSGPDRVFQTICNNEGQGDYLVSPVGNDDIILGYTYSEAEVMSGGLWRLNETDAQVAEIHKNLSVKDDDGDEQLSFNAQTQKLSLAAGGVGELPKIKTDFLQPLTASATSIEFLSNIKMNGLIDMMNSKVVRLATPTADTDAVTKKYVDDAVASITNPGQVTKCESFVFTTCTGSSPQNLTKTNLGACKKACANANVQCCEAEFATLPGNPNATLAECKGYNAPSQTTGGIRNILTILLGGGKFVSALCYLE